MRRTNPITKSLAAIEFGFDYINMKTFETIFSIVYFTIFLILAYLCKYGTAVQTITVVYLLLYVPIFRSGPVFRMVRFNKQIDHISGADDILWRDIIYGEVSKLPDRFKNVWWKEQKVPRAKWPRYFCTFEYNGKELMFETKDKNKFDIILKHLENKGLLINEISFETGDN